MLPSPSRFTAAETLHSIPLGPLAAFLSALDTPAHLRALGDILDQYRTPKSYHRVELRLVSSSELPAEGAGWSDGVSKRGALLLGAWGVPRDAELQGAPDSVRDRWRRERGSPVLDAAEGSGPAQPGASAGSSVGSSAPAPNAVAGPSSPRLVPPNAALPLRSAPPAAPALAPTPTPTSPLPAYPSPPSPNLPDFPPPPSAPIRRVRELRLDLRTLDAAALFALETWRRDVLGLAKLAMDVPDSIWYKLPTPEPEPEPPVAEPPAPAPRAQALSDRKDLTHAECDADADADGGRPRRSFGGFSRNGKRLGRPPRAASSGGLDFNRISAELGATGALGYVGAAVDALVDGLGEAAVDGTLVELAAEGVLLEHSATANEAAGAELVAPSAPTPETLALAETPAVPGAAAAAEAQEEDELSDDALPDGFDRDDDADPDFAQAVPRPAVRRVAGPRKSAPAEPAAKVADTVRRTRASLDAGPKPRAGSIELAARKRASRDRSETPLRARAARSTVMQPARSLVSPVAKRPRVGAADARAATTRDTAIDEDDDWGFLRGL